MNQIELKEKTEIVQMKNVRATLNQWRNGTIDALKRAKKDKNPELVKKYTQQIAKYTEDLQRLSGRISQATENYKKVAMECAVLRTKVYVLDYCLQGAVFELKEYLKKHAEDDGGEYELIDELQKCSNTLMKMPTEFGEYGQDNESYNKCEEIISAQVDSGVRAAFDVMLEEPIKYGKRNGK